eukprot:SAG25_NODE_4652_length_774_cov_1.247407_2_plen_26_part_01
MPARGVQEYESLQGAGGVKEVRRPFC